MVNGYEIKVPITLKGGREGEKVGKQIGEKIASQLKKAVNAVSIGGGKTTSGTGATGMLGVTKGLKGVSTKLGLIGVAITAAGGLLSKASPYFKGVLNIFGRAFMLFFRPFGDFLATLLRPLAILLMKAAVKFMKFMRPITTGAKEGAEKAPQLKPTALGTGGLGKTVTDIINALLKLGGSIGQVTYNIGKGAFELGEKIGQWLYDKVIEPAGKYLSDKITNAWEWVKDFPGWLWEKITSIWKWGYDFGTWIWDQITSIWNWTFDFGTWLWGKIKSIWSWSWDFGAWLKQKIINAIDPSPGNILSKWVLGKGQVGISSVPKEGLYHLHKGEEVIPRTKVGNKSVILNPTFNFTGNISSELDIDELMRKASRQNEMELKQRGII